MGRADLGLIVDVEDALSGLAIEELQYIVDGVRVRYAGAPPDAIFRELGVYQRVRQLDPLVVQRLAEAISSEKRHPARTSTG